MNPRLCVECGAEYAPRSSSQKTCSETCRDRRWKRQVRAWARSTAGKAAKARWMKTAKGKALAKRSRRRRVDKTKAYDAANREKRNRQEVARQRRKRLAGLPTKKNPPGYWKVRVARLGREGVYFNERARRTRARGAFVARLRTRFGGEPPADVLALALAAWELNRDLGLRAHILPRLRIID